mmetsp:Transcript_5504/g.10127  ORF Transcript_5504/g.10127 Transcript_5504/m.10127 type:complete len:319 (-) Transcript_5504:131-1087(-)
MTMMMITMMIRLLKEQRQQHQHQHQVYNPSSDVHRTPNLTEDPTQNLDPNLNPHPHPQPNSNQAESQQDHRALSVLDLPVQFLEIMAVQFGGWVVINSYCFFFTSYAALCIPDFKQNTTAGVGFATFCLSFQSVVSLLTTWVLPYINTALGTKTVYYASELLGCIAIYLLIFSKTLVGIFLVISVFPGIMYAVQNTNPFILVEGIRDPANGRSYAATHRAELNGYLNLTMVWAQILTGMIVFVQNGGLGVLNIKSEGSMDCTMLSELGLAVLAVDCLATVFTIYNTCFTTSRNVQHLSGRGSSSCVARRATERTHLLT